MRAQVGSGARRWIAGLVAMTALCWLVAGVWASPDAAAQAKRLWRVCTAGSGAGQCSIPRGVVADPASGHLFVADQANRRIVELTAWGEFVKAWGWGVRDGSAELQSCGPGAVPPSATCQIALAGSGEGQFQAGSIQGLAMDSSGDIYAVDLANRRVQKFDQEGNFLLMFGGDVNQTKVGEGAPESEQNRCPVDPGDVCQIGTTGTGAGQFEPWPFASFIAVGPGDVIYVGDKGRIQKFNPNGEHIGNLPDPEGFLMGQEVQGLAVVPTGAPNAGNLYLARVGKEDVLQLDSTTGAEATVGAEECPAKVKKPRAIATDAAGDLYVVDGEKAGLVELEVRKFGSDCGEVADESFPFHDGLDLSTGIATNVVSDEGDVDVYVANSNFETSSVSAYGPPPEKWSPPEVAPSINATYATAVSTDSAVIRGLINPHFWDTTRYYLQYGTEECAKGGCKEQPLPPGSLLSAVRVDEDVPTSAILLSGLSPDTTYFYRFVAKTTFPGGEAEVRGVGGEVGLDGAERSFHTLVPPVALPPCPNDAVRTGASARLPDCRAYELVSPGDKEGDVRGAEFGIGQVTPEGERITYSARFAPFADPESAPTISQYLAERNPVSGWSTRSIVPPTATPYLYFPPVVGLFDAFSQDLCRAWLVQESDLVLAPGAPAHFPSLYESDLCGEGGYRPLAPIVPPDHEPGVKGPGTSNTYLSGVQGFSAGGEIVVFFANSKLTGEASDAEIGPGQPIFQLYGTDEAGEVHLISRLPDDSAVDESSTLGAATAATFGVPKDNTFRHAVSDDGSRVFWTCCGTSAGMPDSGRIYLRLNPNEPQSALPEGSASGRGDLSTGSTTVTNLVAAAGQGKITLGSNEITQLETTVGSFQVGQPLVSSKFPPGTKITGCTPACGPEATALTLDAVATSLAPGKQPISSPGPMPFAVGQRILAPGIPFGTTIEAVAAGSLTLSAPATQTQAGAPLSSYSECSEPEKACTIPVSEAVSGGEAFFKAASPDGKRAIFSIGSKLYEYDADAAIAGEAGAATPIADGFVGFMGASEDASRLYFASNLDLGAGPNPEGDPPVAGKANLYFRESGGTLSFIGTLSSEDLKFNNETGKPGVGRLFAAPLGLRLGSHGSRVTPDGLHAAFHTSASLSDYDNAEASSGHITTEVYLYDAPAGGGEDRLRCASCNPSGARPKAVVVEDNLPVEYWAAARIPGWETEQQPSRLLSENGRRLFFEAYDALLPRDTNGVKDIYQWEAAGEGTCKAEDANYFDLNEGCISLISSGTSPQESRFIDASADGSDVFFETQSSLVGQDRGLVDVYDARIGGGFPPPPPIPPGCEGEACQSPAGAPSDPSPASSAYERNDNVKPKRGRCAKGKVRRKGRCVPKQRKGKQGKRQKRRAHAERRAAR